MHPGRVSANFWIFYNKQTEPPLHKMMFKSYPDSMNQANCNILNWNVRGLNAAARRDCVREFVEQLKATIICLQETKLSHVDDAVIVEN